MEEDAEEMVACCLECMDKAVEKLEKDGKYKKSDIKGMGITNQRGMPMWQSREAVYLSIIRRIHRCLGQEDRQAVIEHYRLARHAKYFYSQEAR